MGRAPCCDKDGVKKGAWSPEEDRILIQYILKHGHGSWRSLPKNAGLLRCGKSCRLRWTNYLRPDIKRGPFDPEEEATIIRLHDMLGNKWAAIASHLPGRTDNEIKNFWNTHLKKRLSSAGQTLRSQNKFSSCLEPINIKCEAQRESSRLETEARLSIESSLVNSSPSVKMEYDYFLQLWNSEAGESFRSIKACQSPTSQASSSTKFEPISAANDDKIPMMPTKTSSSIETAHEQEDIGKLKADTVTGSDSISSNEFTNSSNTALKLLMDVPGGNDMEFLGEAENISSFLN